GYKPHQALGQLFYVNQLLGRKYDLVYINALQTARHFAIRSVFKGTTVLASSRGQDFDWQPERYDRVLLNLDHLHVLGRHLMLRAVSRGFSADKITMIPPAALPLKSGEVTDRAESNEITILSVSRLLWTKGYIY